MSASQFEFLVHLLERTYQNYTAQGELGASDHLYELQKQSFTCSRSAHGDARALAFAMSLVFGRLASQADGEPVDASAARQVFLDLDQPIKNCLAMLKAPQIGTSWELVTFRLMVSASRCDLV
jgi:hypothetical protein